MRRTLLTVCALALLCTGGLSAQTPKRLLNEGALAGLTLRNIGPAIMSGRISDIAMHPAKRYVWYVAAASGGVWKTENAGTTWTPIFDGQSSYSIGCVSLDPSAPDTVWVGTGENVSGRHVGIGDGMYWKQPTPSAPSAAKSVDFLTPACEASKFIVSMW